VHGGCLTKQGRALISPRDTSLEGWWWRLTGSDDTLDNTHITIKISGHPPFPAQAILNGHEYVACQACKAAIRFTKESNCFTEISDAVALAEIAETIRTAMQGVFDEHAKRMDEVSDHKKLRLCDLCAEL
jgi:hypothetical protein